MLLLVGILLVLLVLEAVVVVLLLVTVLLKAPLAGSFSKPAPGDLGVSFLRFGIGVPTEIGFVLALAPEVVVEVVVGAAGSAKRRTGFLGVEPGLAATVSFSRVVLLPALRRRVAVFFLSATSSLLVLLFESAYSTS